MNPFVNSMSLPRQFLKYGNKKMFPAWTDVEMSDKDIYTGYCYAAIRNRSNKVAKIATEYVYTDSNGDNMHPYLQIIDTSPTFSNYKFWSDISTYLDLEGVYYLLAIRSIITSDSETRYGNIKEFKLLNPYNIKRVINKETGEVAGYIETRNGMIRELPPEMVIEIRELNPFSDNDPYAMTDALKESQFTLKTSGDYTRHTLKHNINAPGILTTDVILEDKEFDNFTERVRSHTKGEPLFGNGSGAITWSDMNVDLSKAALKDINEQNRETLFSVAGMSKTTMGIEQSGTTRETSLTQSNLLIEYQILPRIQLIIDSLNQDYKNKYKDEYSRNEYLIMCQDPTKADLDKDVKQVELEDKKIDLYQKMLDKGYNEDIASEYVNDEIGVELLPKVAKPKIDTKKDDSKNSIKNKLDPKEKQRTGLIQQQQGALQNAVVNIETELVADFINGVKKLTSKTVNDITSETTPDDFVTKTDKKDRIDDLAVVLLGFYGVIMNWKGSEVMKLRTTKYSLGGDFNFDNTIKSYIKDISKKVAQNHIDTVMDDLYKIAYEAAKKGMSQVEIINEIKNKYSYDISETRAKAVARTETNRAFTRAQYEADSQFIEQNDLQGKVFKKWHTRSDHPCEFCRSLEQEGMIPFDQAFRGLGTTVTVGKGKKAKSLDVDFESVEAGNLHTNCSCDYELVVITSKNQLEEKIKSTVNIIDDLSKTENNLEESKEILNKAKKISKSIKKKKKDVEKKEEEVNKTIKELEEIS